MIAPAPQLAEFLHEHGLADRSEVPDWTPLTGGVSSDIWRVDTRSGSYCVKRALAQLKVAADWRADTGRNAYEWAYMQVADAIAPGAVPRPIAHDPRRGLFAMAWLDPAKFRLWKSDLLSGRIDAAVAGAVGDLIGRIHAASARNADMPTRFATDANFHALRIDPYLLETARRHPDLAAAIETVAARTAATRKALVHGDVSPKNILVGADGPVLLDAEVAWFGDPAFDLAFCINHLAIKTVFSSAAAPALRASFEALHNRYRLHVDWEDPAALEDRAATLLPILALARVDGKSPVEYLSEPQRARLRGAARAAVARAPISLAGAFDALTSDDASP